MQLHPHGLLDFKDTSIVIGPNTSASNLGKVAGEAESLKVMDGP